MAGNIVKWWKHKILGGYKQFSVLQECATDSEELIYPLRAPSSCSAPPDLLLTGDREPIIGSRIPANNQKDVKVTSQKKTRVVGISPEQMLLEEFTCDVSVEGGGKSSQPLQFSFTFYDLDGHHGKITKDDIAGIVYTIYESIGKSVVVPHCGSKTINVRLTVSSDSKSKSAKATNSTKVTKKQRLKSKQMLKCDIDEEDSGSGKCLELSTELALKQQSSNQCLVPNSTIKSIQTNPKIALNQQQSYVYITEKQQLENSIALCSNTAENLETPVSQESLPTSSRRQTTAQPISENIYESAPIVTSIKKSVLQKTKNEPINNSNSCCHDCRINQCPIYTVPVSGKPSVRKLIRKSRSRKQKGQETCHARIRSLSVGNETSFLNNVRRGGSGGASRIEQIENNGDASSGVSGKERNEECLNNLRRNDLIDIIRESMEKNRLCFPSNGKTSVSPTKHHRHRSHTISSKIATKEQHLNLTDPNSTTPPALISCHNSSKTNWCGYDSILHAKICSTNNITSNPVLAAHTSKLLQQCNNNNNNNNNIINSNVNNITNNNINSNNNINRVSRSRHRYHNEFTITASPQIQGYTKLMSTHNTTKLNTTVLNQLNPQLTPEQKLSRTINHVEKWLADDQALADAAAAAVVAGAATTTTATATATIVTSPNILTDKSNDFKLPDSPYNSKNINCKENNNLFKDDSYLNANNITAMDKLKLSDKISKKLNETSTPKKTFNKEILLTRKIPKSTSHRNSSNSDKQQMLPLLQPIQQNENVMEYASIINDPSQSECENLLRASSDESSQIGLTDTSLTTVHHYVHEHIHHHYHHFEGGTNVDVDLNDGADD